MLDTVVDMREFLDWYYHLDGAKPTKSQLNTVSRLCRSGEVPGAFKIGRRWFIDTAKFHEQAG